MEKRILFNSQEIIILKNLYNIRLSTTILSRSGHCCVDIAEKATPILRGEIHYIGSSHPSRLCQNNTEFKFPLLNVASYDLLPFFSL